MVTMARRDQDDVFQTALLRVALSLKMDPDASLDQIIAKTAKQMSIPKAKLATFLASNMASMTAQDFRRRIGAARYQRLLWRRRSQRFRHPFAQRASAVERQRNLLGYSRLLRSVAEPRLGR